MKSVLIIMLVISSNVYALEGVESLEKLIFEKNQDYQAMVDLQESKKASSNSSYSGYYPTLNAVGGWGQNKTDELGTTQKGYLGYLEGKANLFKGFKDQSIIDQKSADLNIGAIELEAKKRELRLQMTEVVSDMIYLHKAQEVLQEELKSAKLQRQMAAKKVSAGLTGPVDNLELDLKENEVEIEIKQFDQLHSENHQKLVKLFGSEVKDAELDGIKLSGIESYQSDKFELKIENNLSFKKADLIKAKYESEKKEIRSEFMPSLDLTYAFGRLTPSENTPTQFNESKYGITVTIPLFSGFETYYKNKSAAYQIDAAEKLKNQTIRDIESEFKILKSKMNEAVSLYSINEKKLSNSQKYFDLTLGEYRRGIKNSPDLVTATDRLFSTKKKKFELLKELEILKVKLENIL